MNHPIRGLHHVTATVAMAQPDLDFYARLLGQRLVKKTVNFDNPRVYHFYYGDEAGTPGSLMTTFPYALQGVRVGVHGAGQLTVTAFSVPRDSLPFWRKRLATAELRTIDLMTPFGEEAIEFTDPSGLTIRLVAGKDDSRVPWVGEGVDAGSAIRGIHGVTLLVRDPAKTIGFIHSFMEAAVVGETDGATRLAVNGDVSGHLVDIVRSDEAPAAINGLGTVHHVAFAVDDADQQLELRKDLLQRGVQVTEVMDRQYFRSIYFREPGGVLFEVATVPPGFTADEPLSELGRSLKLPPWQEQHRGAIEAGLEPVVHP